MMAMWPRRPDLFCVVGNFYSNLQGSKLAFFLGNTHAPDFKEHLQKFGITHPNINTMVCLNSQKQIV